MIVLGLETSSARCSVGIADESGVRAARSLEATSAHAERLPSLIDATFREAGLAMNDLDAVAVSSGPGSFTGLRIGVSAAKGLCFSLGLPLVMVPTFTAVAVSAGANHANAGKILVALDAKKGDFYWGFFERRGTTGGGPGDGIGQQGHLELRNAGSLRDGVGAMGDLVVVTDSAEVRSVFQDALAVEGADVHFRGELVAMLGVRKALHGETTGLNEAEPLYLKDFIPKTPKTARSPLP